MKECKCPTVKIYDGEWKCMICNAVFVRQGAEAFSVTVETKDVPEPGTKREDNKPLPYGYPHHIGGMLDES